MLVGRSEQVHQSFSLRVPDNPPKLADKTGNLVPLENRISDVDISESGRLTLEREMQNIAIANASDDQKFVDFRGHDGNIRLGLMVLGETAIDGWANKGLELTEASILAAAESFQEAFQKSLEENGSATAGASIALNRHQIVINSQDVPDWFIDEHKGNLASMDNSNLNSAFKDGDTFFVSPPSVSITEALNRYAGVKHSI